MGKVFHKTAAFVQSGNQRMRLYLLAPVRMVLADGPQFLFL